MNTLSKILSDPIFDYKLLVILAPLPDGQFGVFLVHFDGLDSWKEHENLTVVAICDSFKEALQAYTVTKIEM
jgi:hypothetical protein